MGINDAPVTKEYVEKKVLEAKQVGELKNSQSFGALLDAIKQESVVATSSEASSAKITEQNVSAPMVKTKSPEEIAKEEQKKVEARKKIEEIEQKLSKLRGKRELIDGGMDYAAVANNEQIFGNQAKAQMEVDLETQKLELEEIGIAHDADLKELSYLTSDYEKRIESKRSEVKWKEIRLAEGYRGSKDYSDQVRKQLAGDNAILPSMVQAKRPEALPKAIKGYYEKEFENVKSFATEAPKFQLNRMYGLALAALESGDTAVAAEALAFTESICPMGKEMTEKIGGQLSKMDAQKKKSFSEQFDYYKRIQRNYMEEINNERERRALKDTPK